MSHRTGMGSHDMAMARKVNDTENPIKTIVRNLRNLPVSKEPRVASHYCNPMFGVLTHVVETLTGGRLGNLLRKVLWEPLGMDSTYLYLDDAKKSGHDLSRGYWWSEKNESFVAMPLFPTDEVSGAGAAISTVLDYAKWIKALLRKDGVLSEAVHDDIRKPRFIFNQYPAPGVDVTLYSLGWFRTVFHGELAYWHSGSTVTHGTLVYWLPERDYGVAMMTNAANEVRDVIMYRLLEERLGVPEEKRVKMNEMLVTRMSLFPFPVFCFSFVLLLPSRLANCQISCKQLTKSVENAHRPRPQRNKSQTQLTSSSPIALASLYHRRGKSQNWSAHTHTRGTGSCNSKKHLRPSAPTM